MDDEKVTFIVVTHNSMPHIQESIRSLYASTNYPFKLIIVESESTDGTKEYLNRLETSFSNIEIIRTKKEGTIKAFNAGIRRTDKDSHIFLFHDDTCFFKWYGRDWLNIFFLIFKDNPLFGILIPMNGGGISDSTYADNFSWAGTWATLVRSEAVEKLGRDYFFDENFGKGYGDDIDMSYRCVKEGYQVVRVNCWVDHHRLTEHYNNNDIEVEETKNRNAEYFRKKHLIGEQE